MARARTRISTAGTWNKRAGGFSLLELLVVLVLIGIFFMAGLPRFREVLFTDPLQRAALRVAALLEQVRETAARQHREIRLQVRGGREVLWQGQSPSSPAVVQEPGSAGKFLLPDGIAIAAVYSGNRPLAGEVRELRVSPKGYMATTVLHLGDADGHMLSLLLSPFAAEVDVREGRVLPAAGGAGG